MGYRSGFLDDDLEAYNLVTYWKDNLESGLLWNKLSEHFRTAVYKYDIRASSK